MAESRGVVAYVPQYERVNSRIPASAWDVVMQGRVRHAGWFRRPGRADRVVAEEALNRVGMCGSNPVATVFNVNRNERLLAVSYRTTGSRV